MTTSRLIYQRWLDSRARIERAVEQQNATIMVARTSDEARPRLYPASTKVSRP